MGYREKMDLSFPSVGNIYEDMEEIGKKGAYQWVKPSLNFFSSNYSQSDCKQKYNLTYLYLGNANLICHINNRKGVTFD